jgi:hypothetical protein
VPDQIHQVQLGAVGPTVGVQGLGCMGMTSYYGDSDPAASRDTLEAALEHEVTLLIENLRATQLTLTDADLAALEPIAAQVVGDRHPDMTKLM